MASRRRRPVVHLPAPSPPPTTRLAASSFSHGSRTGSEQWPTRWAGADPSLWPQFRQHRWKPKRAGSAVIICYRTNIVVNGTTRYPTAEMTKYPTAADAHRVDAERQGEPCCEHCEQHHTIVWCTPGQLHIEASRWDQPVRKRKEA